MFAGAAHMGTMEIPSRLPVRTPRHLTVEGAIPRRDQTPSTIDAPLDLQKVPHSDHATQICSNRSYTPLRQEFE